MGREAPPVIIEGLDVVRDVEGDRWHVKAERVEKRGDISDAELLDGDRCDEVADEPGFRGSEPTRPAIGLRMMQ